MTAARTRWGRERGTDQRKAEARVIRYLVGRGFAVGLASQAVRSLQKEGQEVMEDEH